MNCEPVHLHGDELDFELVVFKSELVQQGGGAWEQGSVRLHFHLDEQRKKSEQVSVNTTFWKFYHQTLTPAVNIRLLITPL